jgi:hypothetical protein
MPVAICIKESAPLRPSSIEHGHRRNAETRASRRNLFEFSAEKTKAAAPGKIDPGKHSVAEPLAHGKLKIQVEDETNW